ncbi:MAG: hypothetical protein IKP47_02940 [Ruminococcus sp.]|nr:hypothetical protein [Ruminococcus sp.]
MKGKRIISIIFIISIVISCLAIEAGAQNFYSLNNTFPAGSGTGSFSNSTNTSWAATNVYTGSIKLEFQINGVCSRYVKAYIEKDDPTGAIISLSNMSGIYNPNGTNNTTMNRSSLDPKKTKYLTHVTVYSSTTTNSSVVDLYSYRATII